MILLENEEAFEELANAVISQAVKDYRSAGKALIRNPGSHQAQDTIKDVEKFLRSGWYQALTTVDGEYLLRKLKEETESYGLRLVKEKSGGKPAAKSKRKTA